MKPKLVLVNVNANCKMYIVKLINYHVQTSFYVPSLHEVKKGPINEEGLGLTF